jgi:chloramphenicol 3-O phosphotransferase
MTQGNELVESQHAGKVILIVGTSSVGKTSTVRELQNLLPEHYLALGIDTFFHMVSPRWGGGLGGPLSVDGFRYHKTTVDDIPLIRITYGDVGRRVLRGMHRAVAALAACGNNVIVDEMLLDRSVFDDWVDALRDLPVYLVRLRASLAALEQREQQRGNQPGLARGHYEDNLIDVYDLDLDTTDHPPDVVANTIAQRLASDVEWTARSRNQP